MVVGLLSDQQILQELSRRFREARLAQNLTQAELADAAGIGVATLRRFERGEGNLSLLNVIALLKALGKVSQLDLLLPESQISPMATLREQGSGILREPQLRRRASGKSSDNADDSWSWGDDA